MKIYTSYYGNEKKLIKNNIEIISISLGQPKWIKSNAIQIKELGNPSVVTNWDMNKVIQIYNRVFHKKRRVSSCGSCMKVVLDDLHKLMAEYETEN